MGSAHAPEKEYLGLAWWKTELAVPLWRPSFERWQVEIFAL